jgi:hypothetical protein
MEDPRLKINPASEAVRFLNQVREKREGQGQEQQSRHQHQEQREERREETDAAELSLQKVDRAVASFHSDSQAQANGLNASVVGEGPGLRVVLKDGSGAVVRQFTGEEFIRLREAVSKGAPARGKILDQKL